MSNGGPTNKWVANQVSTASDPEADTSEQVTEKLNKYPIPGVTTVVCSDGTFIFVGGYSSQDNG
jgi:hypothetical protein